MDSLPTSTGSPLRPLRSDGARFAATLAWLIAALWAGAAGAAGPKLLEPERAFAFSVQAVDDKTLEARFAIASGYYLYREKLHFSVEPASLASAPSLPSGVIKDDEFFGKVETYRGQLAVRLALRAACAGQQGRRARRVAGMRGRRSVLSAPGSKRHRHAAAARDAARRTGCRDADAQVLVQLTRRTAARASA